MSARAARAFAVLGFDSTHDALDAESLLVGEGLAVIPIPAPKAIGSLCGIALRLPLEQGDRAREVLASGGITVASSCVIEDV